MSYEVKTIKGWKVLYTKITSKVKLINLTPSLKMSFQILIINLQ